jgi:hypothetical protein
MTQLFSLPSRLTGEVADTFAGRTAPDQEGPYRTFVDHIGLGGRRRVEAALPRLPGRIAVPAEAALAVEASHGRS